jgi:hypothetical protein
MKNVKGARMMKEKLDLSSLAAKWPSAVVARSQVGQFSGGLLNPRTLANRDCDGTGPGAIRVGRKVAYFVDDLLKWMESRIEVNNGNNKNHSD